MEMLRPATAAEAVANGAQLLDEKHPGWWRHIDLGTLDVGSGGRCICAQLDKAINQSAYPDWYVFAQSLDGGIQSYWVCGFSTGIWREGAVNDEWRLVINARREADRLTEEIRETQHEMRKRKELMLA